MVFPNGLPHGMWCNSKDGRQPVETMFIEDLISYVDANYSTLASRNRRIVESFSMGGYGAARAPKRIVVGKLDFSYPDNVDYRNHLTSLGILHQFREFDNIGHVVPPLFAAMGESNWGF